jgi:hypothetical protein
METAELLGWIRIVSVAELAGVIWLVGFRLRWFRHGGSPYGALR